MKRKTQTETYVVIHKNPKARGTNSGKTWAIDGLDLGWGYSRAEMRVRQCEYDVHNIPYKVIPLSDVSKYIPSLRVAHDDEEE